MAAEKAMRWEVYHNYYEQFSEDELDLPAPPLGLKTSTMRMKVPGGWLVVLGNVAHSQAVFYPDPEHSWHPIGVASTPAGPVAVEPPR